MQTEYFYFRACVVKLVVDWRLILTLRQKHKTEVLQTKVHDGTSTLFTLSYDPKNQGQRIGKLQCLRTPSSLLSCLGMYGTVPYIKYFADFRIVQFLAQNVSKLNDPKVFPE